MTWSDPSSPKSNGAAIQRSSRELGRAVFPLHGKHCGLGPLDERFYIRRRTMSNARGLYPAIEYLTCPSDAPDTLTEPWLSYIGNAGWAMSDPDRPAAMQNRENVADGVFFDNSRNVEHPGERRFAGRRQGNKSRNPHVDELHPSQATAPARRCCFPRVSRLGSTPTTVMILLPILRYRYSGGNGTVKDSNTILDTPHTFGFVWKIEPQGIERINGDTNYDQNPAPANMTVYTQLHRPSTIRELRLSFEQSSQRCERRVLRWSGRFHG